MPGRPSLAAWLTPFGIIVVYVALLVLPATRAFAREMSLENRPIELMTFALLLAAALVSLDLARRTRSQGEGRIVYGFYTLFGIAMLVVAMEEVAWGQTFFGWSTPEIWRDMNAQQETTLHNLKPVQVHQPLFRIIFALGGMIGILMGRFDRFRAIAAPASLLPWLTAILLVSAPSQYPLFTEREPRFDRFLRVLSEMTELLIAIAAFLYAIANRQRLRSRGNGAVTP